MRTHWWQSIRWRLALGSMLVALLATTLLALAAIIAISYYYGNDQQARLQGFATDYVQRIADRYGPHFRLGRVAADTFRLRAVAGGIIRTPQGEDYEVVVYNVANQPVYPSAPNNKNPVASLVKSIANAPLKQPANAYTEMHEAVIKALQQKIPTTGELGKSRIGFPPRSFVVQPIVVTDPNGDRVIGALLLVPRYAAEDTVPLFIATVGRAVLISSIFVAIFAVLAAILFSSTITRPIARLTSAARVLASGDYSTQVTTKAHGEIGELAHSFNEMAAQLNRDVEELRRQELWRRELIMSVTHDLATPLTAIAGLGESLADGVAQSREDYEATGLIIVRETLRLRRLVKDLHVMAKVEAGALQPQCKEIRLATLVDEVLAVLAPEFERADVEPCNAIPYTLPGIQADADMLTRVFSNLCDNAMRHTPPGGTVTIEAVSHGNTLIVSVADTGEGIPPEALSHIFERFYRADSARQSSTGGSGLGLAIVRAIVEAHGGKVWAENAPEGGARIVFTLPMEVNSP